MAFEVSRPASETILGTNLFGSQVEEMDIFIADLSISESAEPLALESEPDAWSQSFSPVWSPNSEHLAFVRVVSGAPAVKPRYSVSVWRRSDGKILEVENISPVTRYHGKSAFCWISESEILVKHPVEDDDDEFDFIVSPNKRVDKKNKSARYNIENTATVRDSMQNVEKDVLNPHDALMTIYKIQKSAYAIWSIETSSDLSVVSILISPSNKKIVIPFLNHLSVPVQMDSCFSHFRIERFTETNKPLIVDISPYQADMNNIVWSKDSRQLWAKVIDEERKIGGIAKIDAETGNFDVYPQSKHDIENIGNFTDEVITSKECIFYAAYARLKGGSRKLDWHRIKHGDSNDENLTHEYDDVAWQLVYCGGNIFLGCEKDRLVRYDFNGKMSVRTVLSLDGQNCNAHLDNSVYQILSPNPRRYNSRLLTEPHSEHSPLCVIRKSVAGSFEYYLTLDGINFLERKMSKNTRLLSAYQKESSYSLLVLDTHTDGSDVTAISNDETRVLGRFNSHMSGKEHAETIFFTAGDKHEPIHCEMIFPVNYEKKSDYGTVVSIYPTVQHTPYSSVFAHNCDKPHTFNPHVYAANGYGVLNLGMPISNSNMQSNGVFEEFSRVVKIGLEEAVNLKLVNKDRLFLQGQSWGAYAATGILAYLNDFKGCIASAGPYNPIGEYGLFDVVQREDGVSGEPSSCKLAKVTVSSLNHPWEDPHHYLNSSPLFLTDKINVPLLLIHGEQDNGVRSSNAEQMYTALQLQNKPVRLITYGGEGHIISARKNIVHFWESVITFLNEIN